MIGASICAGEFKAKYRKLLNEAAERRETLIIIRRAKTMRK